MTAKHRVQVPEGNIEYTVQRSRRRKKTVQVSIRYGQVVVAAPVRTSNREIEAIVCKKAGWILGKLQAAQSGVEGEPAPLQLVTGDSLPYFGRQLTLVVEEADGGERSRTANARVALRQAQGEGEHLAVTVPRQLPDDERKEATRAALVALYRAHAAGFLEDAVARWLPVMGRPIEQMGMPRVLVREQKARWGSCSSDGTLRFSWRLAMLEPELIESVVVHELAHLDVMNHSQDFWNVVLKAMPDAKERRKRLGQAGLRLPL